MNINYNIQKSLVAFKRYYNYVNDNSDESEDACLDIKNIETLELKNIGFKYNENCIVLNNLSCRLCKGDIIQILGNNGTGKSTVVDILTGVVEPNSGCIELNGINIKEISSNSIRKLIGVISQKSYLFTDNIENNIKLGRDFSADDILKICEKIGFNGIINDDEINLDYNLTSFGNNLSGGQCKKVSILQGLMGNPELLILDEPMVNLDEASKNNLIDYIKSYHKDKIVVIISHEKKYDFVDKIITL